MKKKNCFYIWVESSTKNLFVSKPSTQEVEYFSVIGMWYVEY